MLPPSAQHCRDHTNDLTHERRNVRQRLHGLLRVANGVGYAYLRDDTTCFCVRRLLTLRNFTVFIIDDDQGVLDALSSFLRAAGYKTKAYSSPQTFLDEHDPSMPGCALLDMSMPRKSGLDVQHELVTRGIERPIIFLSGRGTFPRA